MDSRQQLHHQQPPPPHLQQQQPQPQPIGVPFTRNAVASPPYGRSPFPHQNPATTPSPYPPASHPQAHPPPTSPAGSAAGAYEHQHQRHPSDPGFFAHQAARPTYAPEPVSHPVHSHSRHPSTSSLGGHPIHRNMAPPSPPPTSQQQHPQQSQPPPQSQMPPAGHPLNHYGHPSASRGPPVNLGPPSAFPAGRELPALNSIPRTGNAGGSMSISAMLGGGAPAHREPTPGHPSNHTAFPPPPTTSAAGPGPGPAYAGSVHASPRMQNATEYNGYARGPQTPPEHVRPYDPRDQRGSVAGSPPQAMYGTPEVARFGTPQAYPQRGPPMGGPGDDRRDPSGRMAAASVPPRPSSQPRAYGGMPGRPVEMGRGPPPQPQPQPGEQMFGRREEMRSGQQEYNPERAPRPMPFEEQRRLMDRDREIREQMDREAEYRERERMERARFEEQQRPFMAERERMERERMERDRMERERELDMMREHGMRERTSSDPNHPHAQRPVDYGPPGPNGHGPPQGPPPYGRMDPREAAAWQQQQQQQQQHQQQQQQQQQQQRPGFEQPPRGHYEQQYPGQRPNDYPVTNGPVYDRYPAHAQPPMERYPPGGPPPQGMPMPQQGQAGPPPPQPYDSPERHRFAQMPPHQQQQQQQQQQPPPQHQHRPRPNEEGPPPPSIAYNGGGGGQGTLLYEPARQPRPMDDGQAPPLMRQHSNNGLLAIGEINRKGRISPLPQAVQGAQPQHQGPAGEPGIKSEFGRMFSGIGSGASGLGFSSPVLSGATMAFTGSGHGRRDDVDPPHEGPPEPPVKAVRKRNRKAKDVDGKGEDDDSTGRNTPIGRTKRPKTHAHHHHHQTSHHHHHHHGAERTSSPLHAGSAPLKNMKSTTPIPSPTGLGKDFGLTHSHQIPRSNGNAAPTSAPKQASNTTPVIVPKTKRSVNSQAVLDSVAHKPRKHLGDVVYDSSLTPAKLMSPSRFGFASTPRPLPMAMIRDNENSTLTVKIPRAHLTTVAREEITTRRAIWGTDVYSDDSDVVAACIHAGWIRGEWSNDIDTDLLDLRVQPAKGKGRNAAAPAPAADNGPQEVLTSPPATGPVQVPHHRDLHVTLLILPSLEKYTSSTRFGIQSREFGGTYNGRKSCHDGISFMITAIRWVDGAAPQSRLRGKARRERIRKAMSEVQRAHVLDIGDSKKRKSNSGSATAVASSVTKTGSVDGDKENSQPTIAINGSNGIDTEPSPVAEKAANDDEVREPSSNEEGPAKMEDIQTAEPTKAA